MVVAFFSPGFVMETVMAEVLLLPLLNLAVVLNTAFFVLIATVLFAALEITGASVSTTFTLIVLLVLFPRADFTEYLILYVPKDFVLNLAL